MRQSPQYVLWHGSGRLGLRFEIHSLVLTETHSLVLFNKNGKINPTLSLKALGETRNIPRP